LNADPVGEPTVVDKVVTDQYDLKKKGTYYFCIYPGLTSSKKNLDITFDFGITAKTV